MAWMSNYEQASLNTTKQIIKDLENIDMVIHIGDLSYANGYLSQWDQFTEQIDCVNYCALHDWHVSFSSVHFSETFKNNCTILIM
jgi:phosphodiesterase/alkaline phosphatase D-like protein